MIEQALTFCPSARPSEIVAEYIRTVDYLYEPYQISGPELPGTTLTMRPTRVSAAGKRKSPDSGTPERPFTVSCPASKIWWQLLRLFWRQGIVANYRRQFWRQLVGIYRQNPSRLKPNIWTQCAMGENLFLFGKVCWQGWPRPGRGKCRRLNRATRKASAADGRI